MSEERLKEIKDYADFKMKLVLNEEKYIDIKVIKELYNEVIRLREKLEISQDNEESYRLEMQDITKCLGLDEFTLFDDVKEYASNLQTRIDKALDLIEDIRFKEHYTRDEILLPIHNVLIVKDNERR